MKLGISVFQLFSYSVFNIEVNFVFVAIGCALGGVCRYLGMVGMARLVGERFPWGTLVVNGVGSFFLGVVLGAEWGMTEQLFLGLGFCGGLTTFSTFSLQTLTLLSKKEYVKVAANVFGGLGLCLLCVWGGYVWA